MSQTVECVFYNPFTGAEQVVELENEERAYQMVAEAETINGIQVSRRRPEDSEEAWFDVAWSLERVSGNETQLESDGVLTCFCPCCGEEVSAEFDEDEFESLPICDSCDGWIIRDQPTERGQSHLINYSMDISGPE